MEACRLVSSLSGSTDLERFSEATLRLQKIPLSLRNATESAQGYVNDRPEFRVSGNF
jgi:hypothetical protein